VIPPELPPMTVLPMLVVVASPAILGALAIVATLAEEELQCVIRVISWVVESLNVPVATNGWVVPKAMFGLAGAMASDTSVPLPTVIVVVPVIPEEIAEIVTEPLFLPCAIPELRIEAIFGFDDFQTSALRFVPLLPSLKVPVACNWMEVPFSILGLLGLIAIETR
jgi:hypothetical protein